MPSTYRYGDAAECGGAIVACARILLDGGLVLIPTETVYGIAVAVSAFSGRGDALPAAGTGYRRIFSLKQRDLAQTVPLLVSGADDLDCLGRDIAPEVRCLAERFWPGALTLIVTASARVPRFMRAADGTVALRASGSAVAARLIEACGCPLCATSANTHAMPAPVSFSDVEPRIVAGVDAAIDAGPTTCRDASTVVSVSGGVPKVLRAGALPIRDIEHALGARCDVHRPSMDR